MLENDTVIYAMAEACKILAIDTRVKMAGFISSNPKAICSTEARFKPISMYALDRNPFQPHLLAFGGAGSSKAGMIDLRMIRATKCTYGDYSVITNIRNFSSPDSDQQITPYDFTLTPSTTDLKFSKTGENLLVSNSPGKIYLYDTNFSGPPLNCYTGHRNSDTVKSVSFYGDNDEFILSGSDCGRLFFWDKWSAEMINFGVGDAGGVVNSILPHPKTEHIATSGLDSDVKIWAPSHRPRLSRQQIRHVAGLNLRSIRTDAFNERSPSLYRNFNIIQMLRNPHLYFVDSSTSDDEPDIPGTEADGNINEAIEQIVRNARLSRYAVGEPRPPGEESSSE